MKVNRTPYRISFFFYIVLPEISISGEMWMVFKRDYAVEACICDFMEGSKVFNRYRKIDEETNRQTMSYLE